MYVLLAYEKDGGYYDELFRNKDLKYVEATGMGLMSVLKATNYELATENLTIGLKFGIMKLMILNRC